MIPKVSVIIPVYNTERYLRKCLDSIVNQTLKDIQIICIDDCSTDNSVKVIQKFKQNDSRMELIKLEKNRGLSYVRNRGIEAAKGKYVYFMDSDDYIDLNTLQELESLANKKNVDIVLFDGVVEYESEDLKGSISNLYARKKLYPGIQSGKSMFLKMIDNNDWFSSVCKQFWNREFLINKNLKFYEGILHEDNLFSFQAHILAERVIVVNKTYFHRIVRKNSIMTSEISERNFWGYFVVFYSMLSFAVECNALEKQIILFLRKFYSQICTIYEKLIMQNCQFALLPNENLKIFFEEFKIAQSAKNGNIQLSKDKVASLYSYNHIYIYGAGTIGKNVFNELCSYDILIDGFVVSSFKKDERKVFCGHRIFELDEILKKSDMSDFMFVVSVGNKFQSEICSLLKENKANFILYSELV